MRFYIKIFKLFSKKLHINFFLIFLLQLTHAFLEIFSFVLILPILKVLVDPNFFNTFNDFVNQYLEITIFNGLDYKNFLFISSGFIIFIYFVKSIIILLINFRIFQFIKSMKIYLSDKFLRSSLSSYHFNLNSSSVIIRTVLGDVSAVCENVVTSFLNSITDIILLLFVLSFVFYIQPWGSIFSFFVFLIAVVLYSKITSSKLKKLTVIYQSLQSKLIESVQNIHRNIKEIKIFKKEIFFLSLYNENLDKSENATINYKIFNVLPKIIYELLGIVVIMLFFLTTLETTSTSGDVMTQMGIIGICAFRIIPSASRISGNMTNMKYSKASVDILYENFKKIKHENVFSAKETCKKNFLKLKFSNISFSYKQPFKNIFKDTNLEINKGEKIGIIGRSGVGKTTFLEILCGLIPPDKGDVTIYNEKNQGCKTSVDFFTYVSQNVILIEGSIKNNIAFGIQEKLIDLKKIEQVCKVADLWDFLNNLDNKLDTQIGELGSKLSGGQKQRISIARALYFDKEIIILDEATSALDFTTEKNIINNLKLAYPEKTLIIISHRETSLSFCDRILDVENCEIIEKFS
jgi:ABC-type multidrug transport system fused ATPase/permease subunit